MVKMITQIALSLLFASAVAQFSYFTFYYYTWNTITVSKSVYEGMSGQEQDFDTEDKTARLRQAEIGFGLPPSLLALALVSLIACFAYKDKVRAAAVLGWIAAILCIASIGVTGVAIQEVPGFVATYQ